MDITIIVIIAVALILGTVLWFFTKLSKRLDEINSSKSQTESALVVDMNQRVDSLNKNVSDTLQKVTQTLLNQLGENTRRVDRRLETSNEDWMKSAKDIRQTIDNNIKVIQGVTNKLTQMDEAHHRIYEVGKDIAGLQEILRAPKLRGTLGELFLGDLLSQVFPQDRYKLQYTFRSGETVDAILLLRDDHMVPIDAKFPLESFKRMLDATDENEKKVARKEFVNSVKRRIDEIASKYIATDEGTLDFALMYVPAENVYYETIIKDEAGGELAPYAHSKRVIPVSPNNLYVYLQTIALGLRGMQIEERAKEILADLSRLNSDFGKVTDSYEVLGKHISSAASRYEETSRLIGKFGTRVEQIEEKTVDDKVTPIIEVGVVE